MVVEASQVAIMLVHCLAQDGRVHLWHKMKYGVMADGSVLCFTCMQQHNTKLGCQHIPLSSWMDPERQLGHE